MKNSNENRTVSWTKREPADPTPQPWVDKPSSDIPEDVSTGPQHASECLGLFMETQHVTGNCHGGLLISFNDYKNYLRALNNKNSIYTVMNNILIIILKRGMR